MAWTFVKGAIEETGSGTSASVSYASAVANGSVVVGFAFCNGSTTDTVTTITDDKGNTYTKINNVGITGGGGTWNTICFWSGGRLSNGPTTITVNNSVSTGNLWIIVDEFTPPAGTLSVDANNTNSNAGTNAPTISVTTTANGDLVYGGTFTAANQTPTVTAGTITESGTDLAAAFISQGSAGSATITFSTPASAQWSANVLSIKAAASTVTWLPTAGETGYIKPILRQPDEPSQFFVRSPSPVPTTWLPTTGQEDRPPPPRMRPDDSSIENPQWFVRSPSPVPTSWLPTAGEQDHPPVIKRPPDEPTGYFFKPIAVNTTPSIWLPTTGEDIEHPVLPPRTDWAPQWFVQSSNPVPQRWLPTTGQEDRPPPFRPDLSSPSWDPQFVVQIAPTFIEIYSNDFISSFGRLGTIERNP